MVLVLLGAVQQATPHPGPAR